MLTDRGAADQGASMSAVPPTAAGKRTSRDFRVGTPSGLWTTVQPDFSGANSDTPLASPARKRRQKDLPGGRALMKSPPRPISTA